MANSLIASYFQTRDPATIPPGFLAYLANLECVARVSPEVARSIVQELADQRSNIKLIASENYSSLATQCAMGNLLTDKYAEGIPHHRFYAGCDNVDSIEDLANQRAKRALRRGPRVCPAAQRRRCQPRRVLGHPAGQGRARRDGQGPGCREPGLPRRRRLVQADSPSSGGPSARPLGNQRLLGLDLASGGHLTHGYRLNSSGKMFESHGYTVDRETFLLDYDAIERQAMEVKPLILLAGFSAYSRNINYARMREIADKVGAVLMVDMAHFAGLVAGKVLRGEFDPIPYAHVVTTTTHKTLRGPRGGLVLDDARVLGRRRPRLPAGAGRPAAPRHGRQGRRVHRGPAARVRNLCPEDRRQRPALAEAFVREGLNVVTGGTDNHLMVVDVASTHGITGRQAEEAVRRCGITLNRNPIPFDVNGAWYTSGLRFGTPAVTTLGMGKAEMDEIASVVALVLKNIKAGTTKSGAATRRSTPSTRRSARRPRPRQRPARLVSGLSRDRLAVPDGELGVEVIGTDLRTYPSRVGTAHQSQARWAMPTLRKAYWDRLLA